MFLNPPVPLYITVDFSEAAFRLSRWSGALKIAANKVATVILNKVISSQQIWWRIFCHLLQTFTLKGLRPVWTALATYSPSTKIQVKTTLHNVETAEKCFSKYKTTSLYRTFKKRTFAMTNTKELDVTALKKYIVRKYVSRW